MNDYEEWEPLPCPICGGEIEYGMTRLFGRELIETTYCPECEIYCLKPEKWDAYVEIMKGAYNER